MRPKILILRVSALDGFTVVIARGQSGWGSGLGLLKSGPWTFAKRDIKLLPVGGP